MKPFNSAFYITVATVIPVWFIALGLQTDFFASSILGVRIARRNGLKRQPARDGVHVEPRGFVFARWLAGQYIYWLLIIVYLSGFVGETISLTTLADQKSDVFTQNVLIALTTILVSATVFSLLGRAAGRAKEIETMQHQQGLPASIELTTFFGKFTLIEPIDSELPQGAESVDTPPA